MCDLSENLLFTLLEFSVFFLRTMRFFSNCAIGCYLRSIVRNCTIARASDISRKKKQNFAGFSGANPRKNRPISREKSQNLQKNRPTSWDFRWRKVKIRRKIVRFRGILAEKSQISKDFQGQILRKISRFHGKFRG